MRTPEKRKDELMSYKSLTQTEAAELLEIDRAGLFRRMRNNPGMLDTEGVPLRIINNNKFRKLYKEYQEKNRLRRSREQDRIMRKYEAEQKAREREKIRAEIKGKSALGSVEKYRPGV